MKFKTKAGSVSFWLSVTKAYTQSSYIFFCNCLGAGFEKQWGNEEFRKECRLLAISFSEFKFKDNRLCSRVSSEVLFPYEVSIFEFLHREFVPPRCESCLDRNIRLEFLEWVIPHLKEIKKTS